MMEVVVRGYYPRTAHQTTASSDWDFNGTTITVRIPITWQRRGGRKVVIAPDGNDACEPAKPRPDETLLRALARAHRWKRMLEEGGIDRHRDCRGRDVSRSFVNRLLRLTLLAPDIQAAILDGRHTAAGGTDTRAAERMGGAGAAPLREIGSALRRLILSASYVSIGAGDHRLSFGLVDFRCSQSSQLLRRVEIVRPQSSFNQRECGAQRLHFVASAISGMAPLPKSLQGLNSFTSKPAPWGPTRQLIVWCRCACAIPIVVEFGREARMLSGGSDLLDCIGAKCGGTTRE